MWFARFPFSGWSKQYLTRTAVALFGTSKGTITYEPWYSDSNSPSITRSGSIGSRGHGLAAAAGVTDPAPVGTAAGFQSGSAWGSMQTKATAKVAGWSKALRRIPAASVDVPGSARS